VLPPLEYPEVPDSQAPQVPWREAPQVPWREAPGDPVTAAVLARPGPLVSLAPGPVAALVIRAEEPVAVTEVPVVKAVAGPEKEDPVAEEPAVTEEPAVVPVVKAPLATRGKPGAEARAREAVASPVKPEAVKRVGVRPGSPEPPARARA
jgi:hypothetical protein